MRLNGGNLYRIFGSNIIGPVNVTGGTFYLINSQRFGEIVEVCTLVTDRTGTRTAYSLVFQLNVLDGRFNSPWTWTE